MNKEYILILLTLMAIQAEDSSCPEKFISIGKFCYHLMDVEMNWEEANGACEGIGNYINETVNLAVLDFGSTLENQLLMKELQTKPENNFLEGREYWLGGKKIGGKWKWVSEDERDIDLYANYWEISPRRNKLRRGDCIKAVRSRNIYSIAHWDCSKQLKAICFLIPKKYGFRSIGNRVYFFSNKNSMKKLGWEYARNVCKSLAPPQGYDYIDLAILTEDTDQQLLKMIAQYGNEVWLGGTNDGPRSAIGRGRTYTWLDGKVIDETSYFWNHDLIQYSSSKSVVYATVDSSTGYSRAMLGGDDVYHLRDFVCQAYKNRSVIQS